MRCINYEQVNNMEELFDRLYGRVILYFVFDLCLTIVQPGIAFLDGLLVRFVFILIVGGIMMFFYLTKKRRTS